MHRAKKLNILYASQPYYIGGAEMALLNFIKNLNPAIFSHLVLFPAQGEAERLFRSSKIKTKIMPKRLSDFIKANKIDIVYTNTPQIFDAAMAAESAGIPHIWHMHCRLDSVYPNAGPLQIRKALELMHLVSAKIIVCSDFVKNQFEKQGLADKVVKINYGIDLKNFRYQPKNCDKNGFLAGMVSRIDPQKRPQDFIKAASRVKKRLPNAKFVLMGGGLNREYTAQIKKINSQAGSPVKFAGFCDDMAKVMRSLDALVLPSVGDASPLVILEAMACAKPVIASNSGGIPEMVIDGKTGILVPAKKPSALADAITELVNNPDKARLMGKLGRLRIEKHYNIGKNTQKLQDVLLSTYR